MGDLSETFDSLNIGSELFKDVKFFISGEVEDEIVNLLTRGGADHSKYFSDFVTHLICGRNPEETDIIDATDVYEVPAITTTWILMCAKLNRLVSTKAYLYNKLCIFSSSIFCLSRVRDDLESLWALITYNGGKVQLNLDQNCSYLVTVDIDTPKYEKAVSLGPERITIVTPDWIFECVRNKEIIQPDLYHPRLIDWPKPAQPIQHESTTAITGFEELENQPKDDNDEIANSTQALLEKLKQRMPWNQPEQHNQSQQHINLQSQQQVHQQQQQLNQQQNPPQIVANQQQALNQQILKNKEIVPPNVIAPSFQQKNQGEQVQSSQQSHLMSQQQIMQKLQAQTTKSSSFSNIPQQMTPEQQQMVQNALQQTQQNLHSQRFNQQNLLNSQQNLLQSQVSFPQQNLQPGAVQQSVTSSQQNITLQQQQNALPSPTNNPQASPLQTQQNARTIVHHPQPQQQIQTQNIFQQNIGINRLVNRPTLQQLRGQLGTTQLQQQLLQQQQQRLNQQQQQQQQQRTQLTLQQQQLLQLQLSQGQIGQARQLLQQNQQQISQTTQPTPINQNQQILTTNQINSTQHLNQNQLSQTLLQNRAQQLNQQQKLAQNHQINQLLAQRQAQLSQRLTQQLNNEPLLQSQQIGQPQLLNQQLNQNQQVQLNQSRLLNQNQAQLLQNQHLKLTQQNQQMIQTTMTPTHQLGQNLMEHNPMSQVSPHQLDQQLGQIQRQHLSQNQNQISQIGTNQQIQLNQGLGQNQLTQNQLNQGLTQSQQLSQALNQTQQQVNQSLSQTLQSVQGSQQLLTQQSHQLSQNQLLSQGDSLGQTQTQRMLQSQQLNPQITQTQPLNQVEQQNQQLITNQQMPESPRQQISLGLNHLLNQHVTQNQMVAQQRLNQNQLINQQLNQLNQQLNQNQITHQVTQIVNNPQQIPQSPIGQGQNQQFTGLIQQQQLQNQQQQQQQLQNQQQLQSQQQMQGQQNQQILGGQVRQLGNQQIIQQQFPQGQPFAQVQQQDGGNQGQVQNQQGFPQQLLLNQQNQFAQQQQQQQSQNQQTIQQNQTVRPHIQQQLWTQQPSQGQVQLPRQALNIQQGQRIQWTPGQPGPGPQRQFIQLDAQTHNQLQKMPPEQQALFVQKLQQKQRQLLLKQAQQRGGGHILIRGSVPPGLSPQQQMAWLQQQAKNQGLVIPNNLQQQTISSTTLNQSAAPVVQSAGPSNIPQTPGLSPIQQNAPLADSNQMKLKQLRLQQFPLQREPMQKTAPSLQPNIIRPVVQPPPVTEQQQPPQQQQQQQQVTIQDSVVGQSPLIVNPKTKTALANMLSIRLQSGGSSVGGGQETIPEPSAAGTLRLMTAQHNASLNANNRPLDLLSMQQRRVINGPNGEIIRPPVPQPLPVTPQNEPPQLQFSPRATVPVQHRPGPFYGHNPNLKLPPDLYFLGCIFVVVEVEEYLDENLPNWVEKIEKHGGEVEKQYCNRVTHVLCETQRHGVVMQALRDCKRCVTLYWLEDIIKKKQLLPPWTALHVPTIYLDTTPCSKHLISVTGFNGQERGRIIQMIQYTGAKYTPYFSKHNTLLIAAKQDGPKYIRAKKWGTPVVNVQWLTDVMLGNFVAMNQMENIVYQQFSDTANFNFDPKICPNLMHGWKMPINISQETYERVKRSSSPSSTTTKKIKLPKVEKMEEDESAEEITAANPNYNILFSNTPSLEELTKIVRKLGGTVTNDHHTCTHLVMENLNRTNKMLFCVPRGVPILPKRWLQDSEVAEKFVDETLYTFPDVDIFNKDYNCDLYALLKSENRDRLFAGKSFWVTPSVFPNEKVVIDLIASCGGVVERIRRSAAQIGATNQTAPHTYFIVTHEDDIHLTADLLKNKKEKIKYICNTELVFNAIMTQKVEVEPWSIKVIL